MTIKPTTDALGTAEYFRVFYKPRRYYRPPNAKSLARAVILVQMAGPIAAFCFRDVPMDASCGGDFERAIAEAKAAGIEHERKRLIRYAYHLVQRHHEKITRVASELVERKSGHDVSIHGPPFYVPLKRNSGACAARVGRPERENIAGMLPIIPVRSSSKRSSPAASCVRQMYAGGDCFGRRRRDHRPHVRISP